MNDAARVPLIEPGTRPELAEIEREIVAERGRISPLYQALLNSPPIAGGWEKLLTAVRNRTPVPAHLREIIILRVAVLNRAPFEFAAHIPHAERAGVSGTQIEALRKSNRSHRDFAPGIFDERECLVLHLTDTMTRDIDVPNELMDRLRAAFDARAIVELVTIVAAYNMVSRLLVALNIVSR